jgi:hypothetical protein
MQSSGETRRENTKAWLLLKPAMTVFDMEARCLPIVVLAKATTHNHRIWFCEGSCQRVP